MTMKPVDVSIILLLLSIGVFFIAIWAIAAVNYAMRRREEYDDLLQRVEYLEQVVEIDHVVRSYRGAEQGHEAG